MSAIRNWDVGDNFLLATWKDASSYRKEISILFYLTLIMTTGAAAFIGRYISNLSIGINIVSVQP